METRSRSKRLSLPNQIQVGPSVFERAKTRSCARSTVFVPNPAAVVEPKRAKIRPNLSKRDKELKIVIQNITGLALEGCRAEVVAKLVTKEESKIIGKSTANNNDFFSPAIFIPQLEFNPHSNECKFEFDIRISKIPRNEEGCEPPAKVLKTEKSFSAELTRLNKFGVLNESDYSYLFVIEIFEECSNFHQTGEGSSNIILKKVVESMSLHVQIAWTEERDRLFQESQSVNEFFLNIEPFESDIETSASEQRGSRSEIPCAAIKDEIDSDSDSENDEYPDWFKKQREKLLEAASETSRKEKSFKTMWNEFQLKHQ